MKYYRYRTILKFLIILVSIIILLIIYIKNSGQISEVFASKKELPIYSVDRKDKKIAITIDCAWGDDYTLNILDILDKYNVKATFFLVGFWIDEYPHQVKEIHNRGHEIGNHSSTHPNMSQLSREEIRGELETTGIKIQELTNKKPIVFRPPYGDYNDMLIQTARELGYYTIQWDIDSLDWKELGVEPVVDRVVKNVTDGSIILCHNNAKYIREYLPIIIQRLQEKGYEFTPVSQLIYKDNFEIDNSGRQILMK
ncbi:MAG: polysaccharide deacetylase family sporulation protein PdaB [Tissierellia bacterium]|nr:polysaccharide deacetylase family sporulation protein PdaB [Tissierellia bacterium]